MVTHERLRYVFRARSYTTAASSTVSVPASASSGSVSFFSIWPNERPGLAALLVDRFLA